MSNTVMNEKTVRFTIDFFGKKIIGTKASFNKAGKGSGAEYEELAFKMAQHPDFALVIKEQKHRNTKAKRTYDGLDFLFMEAFIATQKNSKTLMEEYEAVKAMGKKTSSKSYPLTKKWFLGKFSTKDKPFDMVAAKKMIADNQIAMAVADTAQQDDSAEQATAEDKAALAA